VKEAEPTIAKKIGSLDRLWASLARLRADPVASRPEAGVPIDGFLYWLDRAALDAGMRPALGVSRADPELPRNLVEILAGAIAQRLAVRHDHFEQRTAIVDALAQLGNELF
jgi:hypothetical protein